MDKAIVERAVRALAALNIASDPKIIPSGAHQPSKRGDVPACGSSRCAGCYEVEPGVRIHPPKCGEDYRVWLEEWEAKGKVQ